jgi:hypothetical protein
MSSEPQIDLSKVKLSTEATNISEIPDLATKSGISRFEDEHNQAVKLLELENGKVSLEIKKAELANYTQDMKAREKYADKMYGLIAGWLKFVAVVVFLQGVFGETAFLSLFKLGSEVLITLITTTTATVIGLFIIVANYFFFRDGKNKASAKEKEEKEDQNS